jgi:DNA-binding beta-propeller fold protein YncE
MQSLLVSMMRLSAALTLYGLEQIQTSVYVTQGGQNPLRVLDKLEIALNSLTEALVDNIGDGKKTALESVTTMAQDLVRTSFEGVTVIDPRQLLRATDSILRSSSETMADWVDRVGLVDGEEPRPAAEVLA